VLPYCAASLSALVGEKQLSETSNNSVNPIPELASTIADCFFVWTRRFLPHEFVASHGSVRTRISPRSDPEILRGRLRARGRS